MKNFLNVVHGSAAELTFENCSCKFKVLTSSFILLKFKMKSSNVKEEKNDNSPCAMWFYGKSCCVSSTKSFFEMGFIT